MAEKLAILPQSVWAMAAGADRAYTHSEPKRQWASPQILCHMANKVRSGHDFFVLAFACISIAHLLRVGEACSLRTTDLQTRYHIRFYDDKRQERWVPARMGVWATLGDKRSLGTCYCATTPQHSPYSQLLARLKSACSNCCWVHPGCTSNGMHSTEWAPRLSPQRGPSFKSLPFGAHGSPSAKRRHTHPLHLTGPSSCRVNCPGPDQMALLPLDPLTACKSGLWGSCLQNPVNKGTRPRYPFMGATPRMTRTLTQPSPYISPHPSSSRIAGVTKRTWSSPSVIRT